MNRRVLLLCSLVAAVLAAGLGGCSGTRPSELSSELLSYSRVARADAVYWDFDIRVWVTATGDAFNDFQGSELFLQSAENGSVRADDRWLNFNGDGYPDSYSVEAFYESVRTNDGADEGAVTVTVRVDDLLHSSGGDEIYRAVHEISWDEDVEAVRER